MSYVLALTGGIATGKSTADDFLKRKTFRLLTVIKLPTN